MTGEFINVGVILYVPSDALVDVRVRPSIGRLRRVFPDLDREAFSRAMRATERSIRKLAVTLRNDGLFASKGDAATIASRALPQDDSSLQWSVPAGAGLTRNPTETLDLLYDRFVARYDTRSRRRRTDDDIWRPVRQRLDERNLLPLLQEKTFTGGVDEIAFEHAWKNGIWQVYEPLSFDLADSDGIKTKAREWLGHLSAVSDATTEPFKPHFIVGAPTRSDLKRAYDVALAILRKAPMEPEIFEENQVEDLVAQIENGLRGRAVGLHSV
jgi:hypothetical protein